MPAKSSVQAKGAGRSRAVKQQADDNDKENVDQTMTSKKIVRDQPIPSSKKRTKRQSPSPDKNRMKSEKTDVKSSRSRSTVEEHSMETNKESQTMKKKKKTAETSPKNESTSNGMNTSTGGKNASRVLTTPIMAKNIRHRSASSSSITKIEKKKSLAPVKPAETKRQTTKMTLVSQPRSKSSFTRSTRLLNPNRRTIRRQTNYLTVPSQFNVNIKGGQVLAVGENGMTQLGLKSAIDQRKNPQPVLIPEPVVQIAAGPLHSVCLTEQNNIYTFGCNDEHALGRPDIDEDENENNMDTDPFGEVDLSKVINQDEETVVQIVAGDSHTVILTSLGKVYGWGTYRSSTNGIYGLVRKRKMAKRPVEIPMPEKIVKLSSGSDFVLFLSESGQVYSSGNAETGQLGRLSRYAAEDGRRGGLERLITPAPILYNRSSVKEKGLVFDDIFTGAHHYFLKVQGQSYILAGGLNNFHQIGLSSTEPVFFPTHISSLDGYQWKKFAGGLHHTLGLTVDGEVYAMGRCHEGQLGIDGITDHTDTPRLIKNIPKAVDIACGNHVSFVIDEAGKVHSFGTGTSLQHGHGEEDIKVPRMMSSKFMDIKKIANIAVGAQHTIFLTKE